MKPAGGNGGGDTRLGRQVRLNLTKLYSVQDKNLPLFFPVLDKIPRFVGLSQDEDPDTVAIYSIGDINFPVQGK